MKGQKQQRFRYQNNHSYTSLEKATAVTAMVLHTTVEFSVSDVPTIVTVK